MSVSGRCCDDAPEAKRPSSYLVAVMSVSGRCCDRWMELGEAWLEQVAVMSVSGRCCDGGAEGDLHNDGKSQ